MNSKCVIGVNVEVGGFARIAHSAVQYISSQRNFAVSLVQLHIHYDCGTAVGLSSFSVLIHLAR